MALYDKPLEQITSEDILSLKANEVREGLHIEYKQALPDGRPENKRNLLESISSFANASGGDILFGVTADRDADGKTTGLPGEFCGMGEVNLDQEQQRIQNAARDALDPGVQGIRFRPVSMAGGELILIVRVPRSWASPHMVKESYRFHSRNSSGKYPLGVHELRQAFLRSEVTSERLRRFRMERLANIVAGETPVALAEGPKVVLHVVPLSALDVERRVDLDRAYEEAGSLLPIGTGGTGVRYNFDGLLMVGNCSPIDSCVGYTQLFRTGAIESVSAQPFEVGKQCIASTFFEREVVQALGRYLSLEQRLAVAAPFVVMLSLVGVKHYWLAVNPQYASRDRRAIERDSLVIPEALIEDPPTDLTVRDAAGWLQSSFDALWNACGYPGSLNYDEQGRWKLGEAGGA